MGMLEWSDALSVGVGEIDVQHQGLVEMVNRLYDSMKSDSAAVVLLATVEEMRAYAVVHFDTEERLMAGHAYPELGGHMAEHRDFTAKVSQVQSDCGSGKCALSMDILNFLSNWLVTHIHDTDKKLGAFLVAKGVH